MGADYFQFLGGQLAPLPASDCVFGFGQRGERLVDVVNAAPLMFDARVASAI
ncbi:hypothetical protein [Ralstonia phage phiRSL1]|uniref:Uncharacterized protein n=1 Tax=Ralstonia phage phiRSL1 TaxID=1980924 RepID=B2ZYG2_9CAUD|nr:hypothetical protein RSL1_ORF314 [Ralstonia phage phiRSL1]BAG41761.2 hypothetical protein [Ralstonia phage phiRSL1]